MLGVDESVAAEVIDLASWVHVDAGDVVFSEGDPSDSGYLVVSGRLAASRGGAPLGEIGRGEIVGEMGLLERVAPLGDRRGTARQLTGALRGGRLPRPGRGPSEADAEPRPDGRVQVRAPEREHRSGAVDRRHRHRADRRPRVRGSAHRRARPPRQVAPRVGGGGRSRPRPPWSDRVRSIRRRARRRPSTSTTSRRPTTTSCWRWTATTAGGVGLRSPSPTASSSSCRRTPATTSCAASSTIARGRRPADPGRALVGAAPTR